MSASRSTHSACARISCSSTAAVGLEATRRLIAKDARHSRKPDISPLTSTIGGQVGEIVAFLVSDACSYINGANIQADGGCAQV
jgi:hypothetical protein